METVIGVVTDFNSRFKEDGTIECSVTISSKNYALLDHIPSNQQKGRIVKFLDLELYTRHGVSLTLH